MKRIKSYNGPSKIWFTYQHKLDVASGYIVEAVKNLPPNKENASLVPIIQKFANDQTGFSFEEILKDELSKSTYSTKT